MNTDFSRTLSLLRQERGLSQRQVAKELGISQALLSHYENGAREPGLAFVKKACDFYRVSADFLLGRTLSRDGTTIVDADTLYDAAQERDHILRGSVLATLSRKLLTNSVGVVFDLLGKTEDKDAIRAAANYLSAAVYQVYRDLYRVSPGSSEDFFSVSDRQFLTGLTRVDMTLSEAEYVAALEQAAREGKIQPMPHDGMTAAYPGAYQSLLQIVHSCGERMNAQMEGHGSTGK